MLTSQKKQISTGIILALARVITVFMEIQERLHESNKKRLLRDTRIKQIGL